MHMEKGHLRQGKRRKMGGQDGNFPSPQFPCQLGRSLQLLAASVPLSDDGKSGFACPSSPEIKEEPLWLLKERNLPCAKKAKIQKE